MRFLDSKVGEEGAIVVCLFLPVHYRICFILVDFDLHILANSVAVHLLADAVCLDEDLVDRFGRWIVDLGDLCSFRDVHALVVDEINQLLSLFVGDWFVFFAHW